MRACLWIALIPLAATAGEFQWTAASWTTSEAPPSPQDGLGFSTNSSNTNQDRFTHTIGMGATNPEGPGGPSGTGRLNFQRSFTVTGTPNEMVPITFALTLSGFASSSSIGSNGSQYTFVATIVSGPAIYTGVGGGSTGGFSANLANDSTVTRSVSTGPTGTQLYSVSGYSEVQAYAFSGPGAGVSATVIFGVVPEPSEWLLGGTIALGLWIVNSGRRRALGKDNSSGSAVDHAFGQC